MDSVMPYTETLPTQNPQMPIDECVTCAAFFGHFFAHELDLVQYPTNAYLRVILGSKVKTLCTRLFGVLPDNVDTPNPNPDEVVLIHSKHYQIAYNRTLINDAIKTALDAAAVNHIRSVSVAIDDVGTSTGYDQIHYEHTNEEWTSHDEKSYWQLRALAKRS